MKKLSISLLVLLFLSSVWSQAIRQDQMKVHYIDVGQAASSLLEFPCGAILIDAGAQDDKAEQNLINYLEHFFSTRPDLNHTLDLVIITHDHVDHDYALEEVVNHFTVKKFVDNGLSDGSGKNQKWLQEHTRELGITYGTYSFEKITANNNHAGYTDTIVDPIKCSAVDPKIILYSGSFDQKPAKWSAQAFKNGNNHSLVIKVIFDKSIFLFTGDLEQEAINVVTDYYKNTTKLNAGVWEVGHHGSYNATSDALLKEISPQYTVISCGHWDYGTHPGDNKLFKTYVYGHPRIVTLDKLAAVLTNNREAPIQVQAASASKVFQEVTITKSIYATPWDKTVIITADRQGHYQVSTGNN